MSPFGTAAVSGKYHFSAVLAQELNSRNRSSQPRVVGDDSGIGLTEWHVQVDSYEHRLACVYTSLAATVQAVERSEAKDSCMVRGYT